MSNEFSTLHHICVVVRDLEAPVAFYESDDVGPWSDFPSLEALRNNELQVPSDDFFLLRYKFAQIDNVQLQLCEPPEGDSPQRVFLDERGEGVFHLGFTVPNVDAAEAAQQDNGIAVLMRGRLHDHDHSGFTYFDTADKSAGVVLEIRQSGGAGIPR